MAAPTTLSALLTSLSQSLSLAQEATPKLEEYEHPPNGISLLDVKNDLLLSYLQNLVFLILLKLRNAKSDGNSTEADEEIPEAVRLKLVELRVYLEKGVRPLEEKLKFSIDRFLRTAQDAQREQQRRSTKSKAKGKAEAKDYEPDESRSDRDSDGSGFESDDAESPVIAAPRPGTLIDVVSIKPAENQDGPPGIYRPPRRERKVMETTRPREKAVRRPLRSHTMDEFISAELSTAPLAEPSIGTTIVQGGRRMKTSQERKIEEERREYEETNLVRLPKASKKERAKMNQQAGRSGRMQFGGEDWRELGEGVDRIDRLTKRKGPAGSNVRALLEKSRKRGMDTTDGPRGSGQGVEIGERFRKKVKTMKRSKRR
ncbi:hypothetical protein CDD81_4616 [Ophiocordyceps australis]|uniref:Sas10 C-terminal domain-containing protein n=1 Tax=Ophiocordyceps australis TaxID=1399860 RepID=A0A2C5Y4H1_9HYPO|nr:hypothetical protein CDD81_4616 [Ophiocordyceps australis]